MGACKACDVTKSAKLPKMATNTVRKDVISNLPIVSPALVLVWFVPHSGGTETQHPVRVLDHV